MLELWVHRKRHLKGILGIGIFYEPESEDTTVDEKVKELLCSIKEGSIKITIESKNKQMIFKNGNGLDLCFEIKRNQRIRLDELKQFIIGINSMKEITISEPRFNSGFYIIQDIFFDDVEGFPIGKMM
ncbi:hypothetical protein KKG48_01620 [Patescibacteria group bacterium]|nr:hypothetical protein [Patescibacteria group bacterium]MCG2694769.1 hypothetical protein [Candidatus Parcubacteria bacterium]